jgi:hypothetical protein
VQPGYLRKLLPASAPKQPDQWQDVIKDFKDILMPGGCTCDSNTGIVLIHQHSNSEAACDGSLLQGQGQGMQR